MPAKRKPKVLIVEDEKTLVQMYSVKFEREGFEVATAVDGAEGLENATSEKPDVILLDIILPKLDGFAVLKALKRNPQLKNIPVLLLTNLGQEEDVQKGKNLGADDYLIKASFTPAVIVNKVKFAMKRKGSKSI